jgi:hypothetical protein
MELAAIKTAKSLMAPVANSPAQYANDLTKIINSLEKEVEKQDQGESEPFKSPQNAVKRMKFNSNPFYEEKKMEQIAKRERGTDRRDRTAENPRKTKKKNGSFNKKIGSEKYDRCVREATDSDVWSIFDDS